MSVARKLSLTIIVLCVLIATGSTAVAGDTVIGDDLPNPPSDLKNASINYEENSGTLEFLINFTSSTPADPLTNNITQIYIDTGTSTGIDDSTYSGSGTTATFYDNLDNLDADERVSVGDNTNVVTPWDPDTSQFDGTSSDEVVLDQTTSRADALVQVSVGDIKNPDVIDYKFVYIDTRNGIEDTNDYTWAPDPDDSEEESLRFSFQDDGGTVPVGTINATINVSNTPVADDTVEFSLSDGTTRTVDPTGTDNITQEFGVNADDFNGGTEDTISATIDGANYTLAATKTNIQVTEGSVTNVTFEPHELINVSGEISGLSGKSGTYTIDVQNNNGETIASTGAVAFDGTSAKKVYNITGINATRLTDGGEVVASLNAGPNTITNDSATVFSTTRYNPDDKRVDFTVSPPDQKLTLSANISEADEFTTDRFNLTVEASATGSKEIDTIKHVIEFDPAQVIVVDNQTLVGSNNATDFQNRSEEGEFETVITNTSGDPVVAAGASNVPIYNLTFKFASGFEPPEGDDTSDSVNVALSTLSNDASKIEGTRLINKTDTGTKELKFTSTPDSIDVYNSETVIEPFGAAVTHLTEGGDMVGAPVKFDIPAGAVTSNSGEIKKIILNNSRTDAVDDTIDCGGASTCEGGVLKDTPSNSTFVDNGTYVSKNIYNITAITAGNGSNVTVEDPRGAGEKIYKRADVTLNSAPNDRGNVTLGGDVDSILNLRGQQAAGGLPWGDIREAQADVNNDGVIDIVDVTIVSDEYSPFN